MPHDPEHKRLKRTQKQTLLQGPKPHRTKGPWTTCGGRFLAETQEKETSTIQKLLNVCALRQSAGPTLPLNKAQGRRRPSSSYQVARGPRACRRV